MNNQEKLISDLLNRYGIINMEENRKASNVHAEINKNYITNLSNEVANAIYNNYIELSDFFENNVVKKVENIIGRVVFFELINAETSEIETDDGNFPVEIGHYIFVKSFSPKDEKDNYGLLEVTCYFSDNIVEEESIHEDIQVFPIEKEQIKQIFDNNQENSLNLKDFHNRQ